MARAMSSDLSRVPMLPVRLRLWTLWVLWECPTRVTRPLLFPAYGTVRLCGIRQPWLQLLPILIMLLGFLRLMILRAKTSPTA